MKITTSQYYEIEEYLTDEIGLVEQAFIQEMTDHIIDHVEEKMLKGRLFENAFAESITEIGGRSQLYTMQWHFRKTIFKHQIRDWLVVLKTYANMPRLLRVLAVVLIAVGVNAYLVLSDTSLVGFGKTFKAGLLVGFFIPLPSLILSMLLQSRFKWLRALGKVNMMDISNFLLAGSILLILTCSLYLIYFLGLSQIATHVLYAILWSGVGILWISKYEHSQIVMNEQFYQTR